MILYAPKSDQLVELEIPDGVKRIAVSVSGGADSALLLYILGKYIIENKRDVSILPFHICYMDRPGFKDALNVTNKVRELLNCDYDIIENIHFEIFTNKVHLFVRDWIIGNFLDKGVVDLFYTAWTRNPKDENFQLQTGSETVAYGRDEWGHIRIPLFSDEFCTEEQKNESKKNNTPLPHPNYPEGFPQYYLECPFANVDKKFISEMFDLLKIKDELFPLTFSCIGTFLKTDGFTKPCGECFWCKEKEWAFGQIDIPRQSYLLDLKDDYPDYWKRFIIELIIRNDIK